MHLNFCRAQQYIAEAEFIQREVLCLRLVACRCTLELRPISVKGSVFLHFEFASKVSEQRFLPVKDFVLASHHPVLAGNSLKFYPCWCGKIRYVLQNVTSLVPMFVRIVFLGVFF